MSEMLSNIANVLPLAIRCVSLLFFPCFLLRILHSLYTADANNNAELISFCDSLEKDKGKRKKEPIELNFDKSDTKEGVR